MYIPLGFKTDYSLLKSLIFFTGSYSVNIFPSPLEKDEEEKLINQMLMGDTDARGKLIEHNLRLVAHIIKKYEGKDLFTFHNQRFDYDK